MIKPTTHTQDSAIRAKVEIPSLQHRVPKLRFPEFEGEWKRKELRLFAKINPKTEKLPTRFVYIDLESVTKGRLVKEDYVNADEAPSRAQRVLDKNDILYQTVRPYQKNNYFFEKDGDYVASTGYAQIKAKESSRYLFHFLHNDKFVNIVNRWSTGTSYPAISPSELGKIKIVFPSLPEQQKIAGFLTAVDTKVQQLTQKKELLEQYKKGVMQQLFSQKLRFKKEDGSAFPDREEKRLSQLLVRYSENNKDEEFGIDDILSLSSKYGIVDRRELLEDTYSKVNHLNYIKTRLNDFVYAKSISTNAPFGVFKANLCRDGLLSTLYFTYKVTEKATPLFLEYYFSDPYRANNFLKKYVLVGDRYITADSDYILSGKIPIPTLPEQQKIANYLGAIDIKIKQVAQALEATEQFKKGLLQQLFV